MSWSLPVANIQTPPYPWQKWLTGYASFNYTNSNRTVEGNTGLSKYVRSLYPKASGKWYAEVTINTMAGGGYIYVGAYLSTDIDGASSTTGDSANGWAYISNTGNKYHTAASTAYGSTFTTGDVIGVAIDCDNDKIWFSKNGVWQASGDPAAGTNAAYTDLAGTIVLRPQVYAGGKITINSDPSTLLYSIPSGFSAWA